MTPTCETCRYAHINWRKGDKYEFVASTFSCNPPTKAMRESTSVQCRRHAPRKATIENDYDGWPWVQGDDWCGEHTPTEGKSDD